MTHDYKEIAQRFTPYPPQTNAELAWRLQSEGYPQPKVLEKGQAWYNMGECRIEIVWLWKALYSVRYDAHGRKVLPRGKLQTTTPGNMVAYFPTLKELKQWVTSKDGQRIK